MVQNFFGITTFVALFRANPTRLYCYCEGNNYHCFRVLLYNTIFSDKHLFASVKGEDIMHEEYIKEITALLERCADISTLDLIYQILIKKC